MKQGQLPRTALLWQLIAVLFAVIPHVTHLPIWVPILLLICLSWRFMAFTGRWSFPHWTIKAALVLLSTAGVFLSYKSGSGISSTVSLLVVGFSLKTLEMYKTRDALVVIYVAYLVASTIFLFDQSVLMALYVLLSISLTTTALLTCHTQHIDSFFQPYRKVLFLLLPVIPLMVVLFLVVPRVDPLWELGLDSSTAKTGLSDQMSPGDITKLTRSAEVAFRATFSGNRPQQKDLYWRAIVLNDFDGRRWLNRGEVGVQAQSLEHDVAASSRVNYEMILEPSNNRFIPALEHLVNKPNGLLLNVDQSLTTKTIKSKRVQYNFESILADHFRVDEQPTNLYRQLRLPDGNPRSREIAKKWWEESNNVQTYLDLILQNFNQNFVYTLEPKRLGVNSIDQFLFTTQEGFCEHFSSATAFMLRAAGIPARIVTGYQGGEWNTFERYLLVRQYDAHAWVEYWTQEKGWQRIDPTAYIAPERVMRPADEILQSQASFLADDPLISTTIISNGFLSDIRMRIEAFNYGWHRWVLGYHHQQNQILSDLVGGITPFKLMLFLLIPFVLVITVTTLLILRSSRKLDLDRCDQAILKMSASLAKQGLELQSGETVKHYCQRVGEVRTELKGTLEKIAILYENIRYADQDTEDHRRLFLSLVAQCQKLSR